MALRVLLADESSTIKKVMQLTLHDFGVEIKVVPVGLDVLQVAHDFKPDIIFADILLPKKNGYEVAQELKNQGETATIPIVLMWSGFMDLDETKFKTVRADGKLEKPFDADTLRSLVRSLVPKTVSQKLGEFLTFPKLPEFIETPTQKQPAASAPESIKSPKQSPSGPSHSESPNASPSAADPLTLMALDPVPAEPDEFESIRLEQLQPHSPSTSVGNERWQEQNLNDYKIDFPEMDLEEVTVSFNIPNDEIKDSDFMVMSPQGPKSLAHEPIRTPLNQIEPLQEKPQTPSIEEIERLVREQIKETVETAVWRFLPDIAEKIIREEISKLLAETEKKFYKNT